MSKNVFHSAAGFGMFGEQKTVSFDGATGSGEVGTVDLFDVAGSVIVRLVCICTETLVETVGGGTVEVGITGSTAVIIAQTVSTAVEIGEIWHDAAPDADYELLSVMAEFVLSDDLEIFLTVAGQDVTDGTLVFQAFWTPITAGASVVAA